MYVHIAPYEIKLNQFFHILSVDFQDAFNIMKDWQEGSKLLITKIVEIHNLIFQIKSNKIKIIDCENRCR